MRGDVALLQVVRDGECRPPQPVVLRHWCDVERKVGSEVARRAQGLGMKVEKEEMVRGESPV